MKKVFITGATGNIGCAVIKHLLTFSESVEVTAGVRNIQKAKSSFQEHSDLHFSKFDFEDANTYRDNNS